MEKPKAEDVARKRQRQGIELSRRRVMHQLEATDNPAYQRMLRESLAALDAELAKLQ